MIQRNSIFPLLAFVAAVITAWAAAGVLVAAQTNAPRRPNLSGVWQLNRDLSEDAREKLERMSDAVDDANRGSGGGHGPGHTRRGRGGHGPGHGGGRAEADMRPELEAQNLILNAPTRFVLTQDDQKVVLTEPDGRVRALPTNNRKVKVDGRDVQTRWANNRLVSETNVGNANVIETYERAPSARQLIVTVRMDLHGREMSVRRVYDAVTE